MQAAAFKKRCDATSNVHDMELCRLAKIYYDRVAFKTWTAKLCPKTPALNLATLKLQAGMYSLTQTKH